MDNWPNIDDMKAELEEFGGDERVLLLLIARSICRLAEETEKLTEAVAEVRDKMPD